MAYSKRYVAGFVDLPTRTTPIDAQFLNAVETALLELLTNDGSVDGQVLQWINASSRFGPALLLNKNIDPSAAIDKSKLNLAGQIANADISGAAAIDRSKLNFGSGLVNADIAAAAAIALSKLAIGGTTGQVVKGDGTVALPGIYRVQAKVVNTTTAATDLLSGTGGPITVAANVMGASGMLRLTAWGDYLNNTGGNVIVPRFQLIFGGTTIFDTGAPAGSAQGSTTDRKPWSVQCEIMNTATNVQVCRFSIRWGIYACVGSSWLFTTPANNSRGWTPTDGVIDSVGRNTAVVDTTAAKTLVLNVINQSALVTYETKLEGGLVEVV